MDDEKTVKLVLNSSHGGFGLSEAGMLRYAELKGFPLYPDNSYSSSVTIYWKLPESERGPCRSGKELHHMTGDERTAANRFMTANAMFSHRFERSDPFLVQVVEELGAHANDRLADLRVEEIPEGTEYRIVGDGYESLETNGSIAWKMA